MEEKIIKSKEEIIKSKEEIIESKEEDEKLFITSPLLNEGTL